MLSEVVADRAMLLHRELLLPLNSINESTLKQRKPRHKTSWNTLIFIDFVLFVEEKRVRTRRKRRWRPPFQYIHISSSSHYLSIFGVSTSYQSMNTFSFHNDRSKISTMPGILKDQKNSIFLRRTRLLQTLIIKKDQRGKIAEISTGIRRT